MEQNEYAKGRRRRRKRRKRSRREGGREEGRKGGREDIQRWATGRVRGTKGESNW
jgi:hypothetical protein